MISSELFVANFLIWISNLIFFVGLLPQIFLNKKLKTASGLSDLFLLGNLNGAGANLIFTFGANLPLVYKIMNPAYAVAICVLIGQRFYFDSNRYKHVFYLYGINFLLILLVFFSARFFTNSFVLFLGWVPIIISLCKKIPQILKIYLTKSVYGFSLGFIILTLVAYLLEISGVLMLNLPTQVVFQDLKGLSIYLIFLIQFGLYKQEGSTEYA